MANYRLLIVAFSVIVLSRINFVRCADACKTHADCNPYGGSWFCCGGYILFGSTDKDRSCTYTSCLNHYCSIDNDCGDSIMCCRSDKCVNKGCSGCTRNSECYSSQVCCRKTFPFNQTVCAANCLKQTCNFNDDCAGSRECCRSGKCTSTGCSEKCTLNSECSLGQYCCKKKTGYYGEDGCSKSCVGEICSTSDDCGAPNECCISNKCVDRGCSGCTTNSNCSTGQYCCKKRRWYELSECSAHCIGKSCNKNDDCGGPGETCDSDHKCTDIQNYPPWVIAVIIVCLVVFLVAVGILLAVVWHMKRKRSDTTQAGTVPLHNTQYQEAETQNQQSNISPTYQGTTFRIPNQSHSYCPQSFDNGTHAFPNQFPVFQGQNPALFPQQQNENHGFNCRGLESTEAARDTVCLDSHDQQVYPQNDPFQGNYPPPPYSP